MKRLLVVILILSLSGPMVAWSELGANEKALNKKYGMRAAAVKLPLKKPRFKVRWVIYSKDGLFRAVGFGANDAGRRVSLIELYWHQDKSPLLESEQRQCLAVNAGGSEWTPGDRSGRCEWNRHDGAATALYDAGHRFLKIQSTQLVETPKKKKPSKESPDSSQKPKKTGKGK